jgi:conjugative relaxase-like TrwC/TraI family protein
MVVAHDVPQPRPSNSLGRSHRGWVGLVLTISKLKRWSINYYIDTARVAESASRDVARAGGGLGEYYSEHETRTPTWLLAGDTHTVAALVGLTDAQRAGDEADPELAARWLDDGVAPNGAQGRAFGQRGVHGFDLTFCAPKSVSLVRALRGDDDVLSKAIADAHTTAIAEAMEYLTVHAGYTRIHNPRTGEKDLVRLPGLTAIAYQHETSRCGDPHLHTHVIVPNRQARADGVMASIDGTSLYHEARAAGVIYQATLRRELHQSLGLEWAPVDPATGMAELAGVDRDTITAWSRRSTALREWAAHHLQIVDGPLSAAQLAAAQKATRPAKPEEIAWTQLLAQWRADARGLHLERAPPSTARAFWRRPSRSIRRCSPAPTSSRSSARSYLLTPSAHPTNCWNPPSIRWRCGSPHPGPHISARATSASPSTPSCTRKPRCSIWSTRATTAPCCGSEMTTPHTCRRIKSAP